MDLFFYWSLFGMEWFSKEQKRLNLNDLILYKIS